MILVHSIAMILALVFLGASASWTLDARRGRYLTDRDSSSNHSLAITFALWAIAIVLLDLAMR